MKEVITSDTVRLGMRLASVSEYLDASGMLSQDAVQRIADDHMHLHASFEECPEFMFFIREAHALLAHTAAAHNCQLGKVALFALLSKTFWAGWKAAQQEIVDEALKAMEPKCPEP